MFARSSPFASACDAALAAINRVSIRRTYQDGQVIHMQDDEAKFLYLLVSGQVRLSYLMEDGSAILHDLLPEGETFGELGVFDRGAYTDMATAVGAVAVLAIPARVLMEDLTAEFPSLSLAMSRAVAARYRGYIAVARDLSLKSLSSRLAQALVRVADRIGMVVEHGGRPALVVHAVVTQTDLGLMSRGSRGNVNRVLQSWRRSGWIALQDRCILILDKAALVALTLDDRE